MRSVFRLCPSLQFNSAQNSGLELPYIGYRTSPKMNQKTRHSLKEVNICKGIYLEPYWRGSHKSFAETLQKNALFDFLFLTLPGNHWKWRMLESPLMFSRTLKEIALEDYSFFFASSYVPLAQLTGLVPSMAKLPSILYFHENQFAYPIADDTSSANDFYYGFIQAVSACAATLCLFNSAFNRDTFLEHLAQLVSRLPSPKPKDIVSTIAQKSRVLGIPVDIAPASNIQKKEDVQHSGNVLAGVPDTPFQDEKDKDLGPIIVWPHRWETDKNPASFFDALLELKKLKKKFRLIVCGGASNNPEIKALFQRCKESFSKNCLHWGYADSRQEYLSLLSSSHIAVSTAKHEFFGLAMMEACALGCLPLVPDDLAYKELYPEEFRYSTQQELVHDLVRLCDDWVNKKLNLEEIKRKAMNVSRPFLAENLCPEYNRLFRTCCKMSFPG